MKGILYWLGVVGFIVVASYALQMNSVAIQNGLVKILLVISGRPSPSPSLSPSPVPSLTAEEYQSIAAKNAKANAEILKEMLFVVFNREPRDRAEFGNWADTLNQGASLEGVYNGLTHSADFRKLEFASGGAPVEALKVFAQELAFLEVELPTPTKFDAASASPLPTVGDANSFDTSTSTTTTTRPQIDDPYTKPTSGVDNRAKIRELADSYSVQFVGASIFTLKRVLGDEALKVISQKVEYREKLALWYSEWVVRISQRNVDFGLALRNKPDTALHFKWALDNTEDRIKWEVLNRLMRVMNEAARQKQ